MIIELALIGIATGYVLARSEIGRPLRERVSEGFWAKGLRCWICAGWWAIGPAAVFASATFWTESLARQCVLTLAACGLHTIVVHVTQVVEDLVELYAVSATSG